MYIYHELAKMCAIGDYEANPKLQCYHCYSNSQLYSYFMDGALFSLQSFNLNLV